MTSKNVLTIVLVIVTMWGCEHAMSDYGQVGDYFEARKNGNFWSGSAEASYPQYDPENNLVILGVRKSQHGIVNDVIGFRFKFNGEGTYKIGASKGWYYTTIGGDAVESSFSSFGYSTDKVVIKTYDPKSQMLIGSFSLSVKNDVNENQMISFTLGNFKAMMRL